MKICSGRLKKSLSYFFFLYFIMIREFISTNNKFIKNSEDIKTVIHKLENNKVLGDVWLSCRRHEVATNSSVTSMLSTTGMWDKGVLSFEVLPSSFKSRVGSVTSYSGCGFTWVTLSLHSTYSIWQISSIFTLVTIFYNYLTWQTLCDVKWIFSKQERWMVTRTWLSSSLHIISHPFWLIIKNTPKPRHQLQTLFEAIYVES